MPATVTKPQISLDVFCKLVQKLSPEELAALPTNKLPRHIPEDVISTAPTDMQAALRELSVQLEIDQVGKHVEDLEQYGQTLANALQKAETGRHLESDRTLGRVIGELANMLHAWQNNLTLDSKTKAAGNFDVLLARFTLAAELAEDLRLQLAGFNRAEYLITTEGRKAGIQRTRLTEAVAQLREKTASAIQQMAQFNALRLTLCHQEMNNLRRQIHIEAQHQQDLQAQIDVLHRDLQNRQSLWRKALAKYRSSDDYVSLQKQISQLIAEKNTTEVIVPENGLQRWLDALVDVSLDDTSRQLCASLISEARHNLFWLLRQYSFQQESGARQIARNPFAQVNPQNAIEFMLLSERFILEYFAHRQQDDPFWFGSSIHERREHLLHLRDEILNELKANLR